MQHFIPLLQVDELLQAAPDVAPPSRLELPPADDIGHDVEENW